MKDRTATETIKGYFYQFDYSIYELLKLDNLDNKVTIEGIEDVDVSSLDDYTAVQCKYYEGTEYNHSVIGSAIRYMLKDFNVRLENNETFINYKLYGFYKKGQEKLKLPITVDYLKEHFLTFTKDKKTHKYYEELGIKDSDLGDFLSKIILDINAKSFDKQYEAIIKELENSFICSTFEAEYYYYNNALKAIKDLSIQKDVAKREISKRHFLSIINRREILFHTWFKLFKTEKEFCRKIRLEFFSTLNISPYDRFFLLETNSLNYNRADLKEIIYLLIKKWSNISKKNPTPFCPYIYLHNVNGDEWKAIKKALFDEGIIFSDGYPYLGSSFECKAISIKPDYNNKISVKLLTELAHIESALNHLKSTREVYQFYLDTPYFDFDDVNIRHTKIQISDLKFIKEII